MPSLVVSGLSVKVAPGGVQRERLDAVDRARAFDNTMRASSTGSPKRDWMLSTPPILRGLADIYERTLSAVGAQTCSGDIIGGSSNLLTRSEQLDDAAWTKVGVTIFPNSVFAPDGTSTADGIVESLLNEDHYVVRTTPVLTANTVYTFSFFAFGASRAWVRVYTSLKNGGAIQSWVNLVTGLAGTVGAGHTLVITNYGGGWYRIAVTYNSGVGAVATSVATALADVDSGLAYLGVGFGIHAWGYQLEEASSASSYLPTTTAGLSTLTTSCFTEITGWTPVKTGTGHHVILSFVLREA